MRSNCTRPDLQADYWQPKASLLGGDGSYRLPLHLSQDWNSSRIFLVPANIISRVLYHAELLKLFSGPILLRSVSKTWQNPGIVHRQEGHPQTREPSRSTCSPLILAHPPCLLMPKNAADWQILPFCLHCNDCYWMGWHGCGLVGSDSLFSLFLLCLWRCQNWGYLARHITWAYADIPTIQVPCLCICHALKCLIDCSPFLHQYEYHSDCMIWACSGCKPSMWKYDRTSGSSEGALVLHFPCGCHQKSPRLGTRSQHQAWGDSGSSHWSRQEGKHFPSQSWERGHFLCQGASLPQQGVALASNPWWFLGSMLQCHLHQQQGSSAAWA